jgi:hypothetical protein
MIRTLLAGALALVLTACAAPSGNLSDNDAATISKMLRTP